MIKFFLKIWPAFLPLIIYFIWIKISKKRRKKDYIEGEFKVIDGKKSEFSLKNNKFFFTLFLTLILIILSLISIVIREKSSKNTQNQHFEQKINEE